MIGNKITAAEGKVFRRISDGMLFGNEIYLGMAFPLDGEPYLELPEHFEEVNDPSEEEIVLMDENTPLADDVIPEEVQSAEEVAELPAPEPKPPARVTQADFRELEKKVALLMKMIGGVE